MVGLTSATATAAFNPSFSMSGGASHGSALATADLESYSNIVKGKHDDQLQQTKAKKLPLKCSCDKRYCNQEYCMTDGVCFASKKRSVRIKHGKYLT